MKVATIESLKSFLSYLRTSFVSPFAVKDDAGNIIKETYLKVHGTADEAKHASAADTAEKCTGNAASADTAAKLKKAVDITLAGDVTGIASFDGSTDVMILAKTKFSPEVIDKLREDTAKSLDSANEKIAANEATISSIERSFRQKNTSYKEDDTVLVKGAGVNSCLRCVRAGTTGSEEDFLPEAAGFKADSLDGFKYDNVHIGADEYVTLGSAPVAAALLATGGGNGMWVHTDAEGNEV